MPWGTTTTGRVTPEARQELATNVDGTITARACCMGATHDPGNRSASHIVERKSSEPRRRSRSWRTGEWQTIGWSSLEVALAWVRDRPGVTAPILGARTAAQLRESLTVEECDLPAEIRQALDDVSSDLEVLA